MGEINGTKLWPFSINYAVGAVPLVWLFFAILFALSRSLGTWPAPDIDRWIIPTVAVLSAIPLLLVLIDYLAQRQATLDIKGVKINFGAVGETREGFALPPNIGIPGQIVADSSPMQIVEVLEQTSGEEIAVVNIKNGDAWWLSRLLVLSAGATRAGNPKAVVFVAHVENADRVFVGWASPGRIVKAILDDKEPYRKIHDDARRIAAQFALFRGQCPLPTNLDPSVVPYLNQPSYSELGDAVFEQILMDRLRFTESTPDRLTYGELRRLFDPCVWKDAIDLDWPMSNQLTAFLKSRAPFVALVRERRYVSLIKQSSGERLILRQLLERAIAPGAFRSEPVGRGGS
jgi:hypothetical protein